MIVALVVMMIAASIAVAADIASKEEGNRAEGIGLKGYLVYFVVTLLLAFVMSFSKVICIVVALGIAVLAFLNKEGMTRAKSWNLFFLLDFVMMLYSIARGWEALGRAGQFPKFSQLSLLLIPIVLTILNTLNGKRLEASVEKKSS